VAVDTQGFVYVADAFNHRIQKFDSNGKFIAKWGSLGSDDGEFYSPWGVAVDAQGFVYVADSRNHRIQKFKKVVFTIYLPLIVKNY
jgi:DNA-binding beta-propeller fold protein YncE